MAKKACFDCRWFESDQEDGNEGQGKWYEVCRARNGVSNLKQFPFKETFCKDFCEKGSTYE